MMAEKIEGLGELRAAFAQIAQETETRTARRMVVAGGGVLKRKAKAIAQALGLRKTGAMMNNIAIKRERTPPGTAQYNLGVRHGRDITRSGEKKLLLKVGKSGRIVRANDPFYWRFLELTTKRRQGTPFIGAALETGKDEAIEAMKKPLQVDIEKASKK
jgi:HK97 gp10 family phage protein